MNRRGAWRGGPPNGNGGGQQNQNSRNNSLTISGPPGGSKTSIHDQSVHSSLLSDTLLIISMAELGMVDDKSRKSDFQTDADISASKGPKERDLQRWVPDGPDPAIASSGSKNNGRGGDSETFGTNSAGGWDQFETNKRLFGGDSTYDENIYTTKLDRSAPDFEMRKREAERLANEIQNVRRFQPRP